MGDILPVFQGLGNPGAAAALSRPLQDGAGYKVECTDLGPNAQFPPEVSTVVAGAVAYMENRRLRSKIAMPSDGQDVLRRFVEQYVGIVGAAQNRAEIIAGFGLTLGQIGNVAVRLAQEADGPVVGAFYLFQSQGSPDQFYGGLMIPRHVYEATPQRLLESVGQMATGLVGRGDISHDDAEAASALLRELWTNGGPGSEGLGFAAASLSLPPAGWVEQTLLAPGRS